MNVLKSSLLGFISDLHSSVVVLLVEGHAELVHESIHLIGELSQFLLFLLFFSLKLLLLNELNLFSLLLLFLDNFELLSFLLSLYLLLLLLDLGLLLSGFLLSKSLLISSLLLGSLLLSFSGSFLLSLHIGLSLLDLCELFLFLRLGLVLKESLFFEFECLLGLHLLLDFEHLELSLSLSSRELMLSLKSGKVGLGSSLLSSGGLGLLNSLSGKELLLHSLSLKLLSGLFFLELFELGSSGS